MTLQHYGLSIRAWTEGMRACLRTCMSEYVRACGTAVRVKGRKMEERTDGRLDVLDRQSHYYIVNAFRNILASWLYFLLHQITG